MRDAIIIPLNHDESLVITIDNSGAIGMKEQDVVNVPYDIVGYYSFRVVVMECMATGARPISVIIQNFCSDEAWNLLVEGVQKGLAELQIKDVLVIGSTESNFSLSQSAIGLNVIGKKSIQDPMDIKGGFSREVALNGMPLVGAEVVSQAVDVVPLSVFKEVCHLQDVSVWPVGSKGVLSELKRMFPELNREIMSSPIDLLKSGGPSTSFLAIYPTEKKSKIKEITGNYFNRL